MALPFARRLAPALLATIALLAAARPALACVCSGTLSGQPACVLRWEASAVFVGRVLRIEPPPPRPDGLMSTADPVRVTLAVVEGFVGVSTPEAIVTTASGSASCGFGFRVGETYLVYANGSPGALHVSLCGGTTPARAAAEDIQYLRDVPSTPVREGRITGMRDGGGPAGGWLGYAGARIFVEGGGLKRSATTNSQGSYEVRVPVGRYRVWGEVGRGFYIDSFYTDEITLNDARGCAIADFSVRFDGHVRTRVVTAAGQPVPHLSLQLTAAADPSGFVAEARSNARGQVDIGRVPPGRYRLGFLDLFFPGTLDPNAARVLTVVPSGSVSLDDFVIPREVRVTTLTGVVRDTLGQVVQGAQVEVYAEPNDAIAGYVMTDARGEFSITVPADRKYRVTALQRLPRGPSGDQWASGTVQGLVASLAMDRISITVRAH
jgi:hypothetical protein